MSRPINRKQYGSQGTVLPKLTASMIAGRKTVLTFRHVREVQGEFGPFWAIQFEEFPEHELVTNATQEDAYLALVDAGQLPPDFDQWAGYRCAHYVKQNENPKDKSVVEKLYAMDSEDQERAIAEFDAHVASGGSAKPAPSALAPKKAADAPAAPSGGKARGTARSTR